MIHFFDWTREPITSNSELEEAMRLYKVEVFLNGDKVNHVESCITGQNGWVKMYLNRESLDLTSEERCRIVLFEGNVEVRETKSNDTGTA